MLDCLIANGDIVDGSGQPRRRADLGVRDGRVVAVGNIDEPARRKIDAAGLVVAPGFIDIHTHYDAQVFWDPLLSPSSLHGVTTLIAGQCGFSIAPMDPDNADYMMRLLSRVEEIPLATLQAGVDWGSWQGFGEYLARLDGTTAPNIGFMIGHSALRRMAMGEAASRERSNSQQRETMLRLLRESLAAGGLGLSSSYGKLDLDHHNRPVPSCWADEEELLALAGVLRDFPGTSMEWLPAELSAGADPERIAALARAAGRPIIWNLMQVTANRAQQVERELAAAEHVATQGGRLYSTCIPIPMKIHLSLAIASILEAQPGWEAIRFGLPPAERLRALQDPAVRSRMRAGVAEKKIGEEVADIAGYEIEAVFSEANLGLAGRRVGDIATERGADPFDVLLDIIVADELRTLFAPPAMGDDEESWRLRARYWGDPRMLVGGTDAGAHVTMIDAYTLFSDFVGVSVRDRKLIALEKAVRMVTAAPAEVLGLHDRGRIAPGYHADLAIFDPERLAPEASQVRADMPAGGRRLYAGAVGMEHVLVSGEEIVNHGRYTDARPGHVLRGGRDTH